MKKSQMFLSLAAVLFAVIGAVTSNANAVVTYYGLDASSVCRAAQANDGCGVGSTTQCTVTVSGVPGKLGYSDTACSIIAYKN